MFKNLTYKKKIRLLAIAAILLALVAYRLAFAKTLELRGKCDLMEQQIKEVGNISFEVAALQKSLLQTESFLNQDTGSTQALLLERITAYCKANSIVLREFPETMLSEQDKIILETNTFTVQGNFEKLLKLQYQLEQQHRIGHIPSVLYHAVKNPRTQSLELTSTVYVQSARKKNS